MRKFILLIRRFWNFIFFIILETTCFILIAKSRNLQGMDLISSSNSIAGYIYKKQAGVLYYFKLKKLNDSLLSENTRLNNALAEKTFVDTFTETVARIPIPEDHPDSSKLISGVLSSPDSTIIRPVGPPKIVRYALYEYIPARVIKNSVSNDRINFITLNRGTEAGIQKGMAVVTGNGIVGRVANVSKHYATVASVLSDRKISACLNDGTYNFIFWNPGSPDFVEMANVPITLPVKRGDPVFTTGYSYFPGHILIGIISTIDSSKAGNSKSLRIRLSTNFRNLQYVYVVKDKMDNEKKKLEALTEEKKH